MTNLHTERLHFNRPTDKDISLLKPLWRHEGVRQYLGGILSEKIIHEKIESLQNHWNQHGFGLWSVKKKNSEELIGLCGLHSTEDGLELVYMFFSHHWGFGFARQATRACLVYGLTVLKKDSIIAITQQKNLRSCHLLERIGMKMVRHFKRYDEVQVLYKLHNHDL